LSENSKSSIKNERFERLKKSGVDEEGLRGRGGEGNAARSAGDEGAEGIDGDAEPSGIGGREAIDKVEENIGVTRDGIKDVAAMQENGVALGAGKDVVEIAAQKLNLFVAQQHGSPSFRTLKMVRDSERFVEERIILSRRNSLPLLVDGNDGEREAEAEGGVDADFDGIDAVFLELEAAEDMHVRRVSVERGEGKLHFTLRDGIFVIGIEDERVLNEVPHPAAPSGPEAELEKTNRHDRRGNHPDDADQCLLSACLLAHILAEDTRLEIG